MTRYWHKLTIQSPAAHFDAISTFLFDLGALGTEEETECLVAYFPQETHIDHVIKSLKSQIDLFHKKLGLPTDINISSVKIEHENWEENWKEHFKPIDVDSKLLVTPSWERISPPNDQIQIVIDPGQAFGTGGHESTFLMLKAILSLVRPGVTVLDAGTGSGILAIASSKLGAHRVVAFDIDPVAIETAAENARANDVRNRIQLLVTDGAFFRGSESRFDLVLANMISSRLLDILPGLSFCLRNGNSRLVLSGILNYEKEMLKKAVHEYGLDFVESIEQGEWICLICRKMLH